MNRFESRPAGIVAWAMSVFLVALATLLTAQQAAAATYTVTNTNCQGDGSILEAMGFANSNLGEDTITFTSGLVVDFATCPPYPATPEPDNYFALQATESVIFVGNGTKLKGKMIWLDEDGINRAGESCAVHSDLIPPASSKSGSRVIRMGITISSSSRCVTWIWRD